MRGDLVTIALQGDYGKPRPAVVIQSDQYKETGSLVVLLLSSDVLDAALMRVTVQPSAQNGLQKPSQVMVDKVYTLPRSKVGNAFGSIEDEIMREVDRCLTVFLGIAR